MHHISPMLTKQLINIAGAAIIFSNMHNCLDDKLVYNSDSKFYMMRSKPDQNHYKTSICRVVFLTRSPGKTVIKRQAPSSLISYDISVSRRYVIVETLLYLFIIALLYLFSIFNIIVK